MIGTILNGYTITEKIKEGSIGMIYKALNPSQQVVALKQMHMAHAKIPRKLKMFKREAAIAQRLRHPSIIKVYEYVSSVPQPFFSMEYFHSQNLKTALNQSTCQIYTHEFRILRQIADALQYVHQQGVSHRDIKPENVLVSSNAEIRLIDFSMAQTRYNRLFSFGKRVEGTPLYMSPEQIRGDRAGHRSDIYSFGVLMFELMTKRPPFEGSDEASLFQKHLKEPPPSLRLFIPTISKELEEMMNRCLAKNPQNRFSDLTLVIHELAKWEKQEPSVRAYQVQKLKAHN